MQFTPSVTLDHEYYVSEDERYEIRKEPSPWEPDNADRYTWIVYVDKYGTGRHHPIKTTATLLDAKWFVTADAQSPVFDQYGDCRWCGIAESDLRMYPRWWFGCNLCESAIETETVQPDNEYEPLHD